MAQRLIEYNGKRQNLTQWGLELGVSRHTLQSRLKKNLPLDEVMKPSNVAIGRELKTNMLSAFKEVWEKCGRKEFQKQLKEAFQNDALKVARDFQPMLPRETEAKSPLTVNATNAVLVTKKPQAIEDDDYEMI